MLFSLQILRVICGQVLVDLEAETAVEDSFSIGFLLTTDF
jgi:hypothetical protein